MLETFSATGFGLNELGHFALVLAFFVALWQAVIPLVGATRGWYDWMASAVPAAVVQFVLIAFSFAVLMRAFILSDFSLILVASNSHTAKPLLYKITGTWGNHEGSMLLWITILSLFGMMVALFGRNLRPTLKARVLAVQAMIGVAFLAFILFTSNPFLRTAVPPFDGQGLNPLLQDPGLAFHPPFLYLGYVGLSTSFSFAVAALLEGRVDAAWARWVRPWTLMAWMFLTIGIALGSWWAYYELGWGGFWFWDPVENASFMPWLVGTALLHSAIVVEKREVLKSWTILLAILAFSFSLIGTFIVRSGVITSVHAFANDPDRGVFILLILAVAIGGSLTLYAARAHVLRARGTFALVSRESALVVNNVLLIVAAFVVFIGTIWPLVIEMTTGRKLSVGAPFFNMAFTPFMVGIAMLLPIGALLPWKRASIDAAIVPLRGVLALSLALGGLTWWLQTGGSLLAPIGVALATWVVLGALDDLLVRAGWPRQPLGQVLRRLGRLPRGDWGRAVAHAGLGVTIFAVSTVLAWQQEDIRVVREGETYAFGPYQLRLQKVEENVQGPNYTATRGTFTLMDREGRVLATLQPEKRVYPVSGMPTTEAAIDSTLDRDVYVVIGDRQKEGGWSVWAYIKPFAPWLWIGGLLMALGGLLSLSDRRLRVAAGAVRKARLVPAE